MSRMRGALIVVVVGALMATLVSGCAAPGTAKSINSQADVAALAGSWEGFGTGPGGRSLPTTLQIGRDGKYTMMFGAFSAAGALQAKGGNIVTVPERQALGAAFNDEGATIEVRQDGSRLIMLGNGAQ